MTDLLIGFALGGLLLGPYWILVLQQFGVLRQLKGYWQGYADALKAQKEPK